MSNVKTLKNYTASFGFAGYKHIVCGCLTLVPIILLLKVPTLESLGIQYTLMIAVILAWFLFLLLINIKFILWANHHVSKLVVQKNEVMIRNYFGFKKTYPVTDLLVIEAISNANELIRIASYLSSKHDNYRIQFSDGKSYFLNGESNEAKNIAMYLRSRLRLEG